MLSRWKVNIVSIVLHILCQLFDIVGASANMCWLLVVREEWCMTYCGGSWSCCWFRNGSTKWRNHCRFMQLVSWHLCPLYSDAECCPVLYRLVERHCSRCLLHIRKSHIWLVVLHHLNLLRLWCTCEATCFSICSEHSGPFGIFILLWIIDKHHTSSSFHVFFLSLTTSVYLSLFRRAFRYFTIFSSGNTLWFHLFLSSQVSLPMEQFFCSCCYGFAVGSVCGSERQSDRTDMTSYTAVQCI